LYFRLCAEHCHKYRVNAGNFRHFKVFGFLNKIWMGLEISCKRLCQLYYLYRIIEIFKDLCFKSLNCLLSMNIEGIFIIIFYIKCRCLNCSLAIIIIIIFTSNVHFTSNCHEKSVKWLTRAHFMCVSIKFCNQMNSNILLDPIGKWWCYCGNINFRYLSE